MGPRETSQGVADDPFGLHLPTAETRFVDEDGSPPTGGATDRHTIAAELKRLIERAAWSKLRPKAWADAAGGPAARAKERRRGEVPDLSGTGSVLAMDRLATGVRATQTTWRTLATLDRAERLLHTVQAVLAGADMPPPIAFKLIPMRPNPGGFDFRTWTLVLREELVAAKQLDHAAAADLTNMLAHELRHAEQYYLTARWMAAQGTSPTEIAVALDRMHPGTVAHAAARGLAGLAGPGLALAAEMHGALVTDRAANARRDADTGYDAMEEARHRAGDVLAHLLADPPTATQAEGRAMVRELTARIEDVMQKYREYRDIPYERDAHDVGAGATAAYEALR